LRSGISGFGFSGSGFRVSHWYARVRIGLHGSALVGMGVQTIPDPCRPFWTRVDHCRPMPTNADPCRPTRWGSGLWVLGVRVPGFGFRVPGSGFRVPGADGRSVCVEGLLITEFVQEDSPFCLTRAITRTMIGPCPRSAWLRGMLPEDGAQGFGFWGFGFRISSSVFRVSGSGFRIPGSGFRVLGFGFQVPGSGLRVPGSGVRGFRF